MGAAEATSWLQEFLGDDGNGRSACGIPFSEGDPLDLGFPIDSGQAEQGGTFAVGTSHPTRS